jgi:hypothetical protein
MFFADIQERLSQIEDSVDLTSSQFFSSLIKMFPDANYFVPLKSLTTMFPNVSFYSVRATFKDQDLLKLVPISSNVDPNHFTLIIRCHQETIGHLRKYIESELDKYYQMDFQVNTSLYPVGYASIESGSIIIFLASTTTTLESQLSQFQNESLKTKIKVSKLLIDFLQKAHEHKEKYETEDEEESSEPQKESSEPQEEPIFGFDLRPSSILFNLSSKDFSIALIGYVGDSIILQSYPDASKLVWDSKNFPPELQTKSPLQSTKVTKQKF